jgi:hypothetical protein
MLDEMSLAFGPVNQGTSGHSIVTIMDDPKFEKEFGKMYDLVVTIECPEVPWFTGPNARDISSSIPVSCFNIAYK